MQLNNQARIAVSGLLLIMQSGKPTSLQSLTGPLNTSVSYLEQIFRKLREAGPVTAGIGRGGGYSLAKPVDQIDIASIIQALNAKRASAMSDTIVDKAWRALNERANEFLQGITLDACAQAMNG